MIRRCVLPAAICGAVLLASARTAAQTAAEFYGDSVRLKSTGKARIVANIFHSPHMPTIDEYYEPWTYDYETLFTAPEGDDQPVARPISLLTGRPIDPQAGPNWDDDLGGSPIYAENDPNLAALGETERRQLFAVDNWAAGKSEKCILCYPRIESGQAPACCHSCVGRIRYVGVLLYDASRLVEAASAPADRLVDALRKQQAVRAFRRAATVGDIDRTAAREMLTAADGNEAEAEAIYRLTSLCRVGDRVVLPAAARETAIEQSQPPLSHKQSGGFGFLTSTREKP